MEESACQKAKFSVKCKEVQYFWGILFMLLKIYYCISTIVGMTTWEMSPSTILCDGAGPELTNWLTVIETPSKRRQDVQRGRLIRLGNLASRNWQAAKTGSFHRSLSQFPLRWIKWFKLANFTNCRMLYKPISANCLILKIVDQMLFEVVSCVY